MSDFSSSLSCWLPAASDNTLRSPSAMAGSPTDRETDIMYTLKIHWARYDEQGEKADESTIFVQADQVEVHGMKVSISDMAASWPEGSFFDYHIDGNGRAGWGAKIVRVELNNKLTWYLVSNAWLLGADGKTIERLA